MLSLGYLSYLFPYPRMVLGVVFIISYIMICVKFISPKELRKSKLKFLTIPTILIIIGFILSFNITTLFLSLIGSYIVGTSINNLLNERL